MKRKVHSFKLIILLSIVLPVSLLFIYDCSPGNRQIAQAESHANGLEMKNSDEKAVLKKYAEQRIRAGDIAPPRVEDPGYPVADCILPDNFPADKGFVSFDTGFLGKIQYTCFNKEAGKSIVAWRTWYCEGSENKEACIFGKWVNGEPTFKGLLIGTHETGLGNIIFCFKKCNTK